MTSDNTCTNKKKINDKFYHSSTKKTKIFQDALQVQKTFTFTTRDSAHAEKVQHASHWMHAAEVQKSTFLHTLQYWSSSLEFGITG